MDQPSRPFETRDQQTRRQQPQYAGSGSRHAREETRDEGRSVVEWITLGFSAAVVLGLVALVAYLYVTGAEAEPVIEVQSKVAEVRYEADRYYLPIVIENTGGRTAEEVIVNVSLTTPDGGEESSEVTIPFLSGRATANATVVFKDDPREGQVTADVISYIRP